MAKISAKVTVSAKVKEIGCETVRFADHLNVRPDQYMAHETLVYGFIASAGPRELNDLPKRNEQVLASLPQEDEFPYMTRSMFSLPGSMPMQGTFRTPIIHFGGSMNRLDFDEVPKWIGKFEALLSRLFWHEATAHVWTDYIDGCYQYWWRWDDHVQIVDSYATDNPQPTSKWIRTVEHLQRHLNAPPGGLYK